VQGIHGYRQSQTDWSCQLAIAKQVRWRYFRSFACLTLHVACQVGIITNEYIDTLNDMRSSAHAFADAPSRVIKPGDDSPDRAIALTGDDIGSFEQDDWNMVIGNYTEVVFARTTLEQKLRVVEEIKLRGDNIVAVMGDGVNDAPALKASDIGVAVFTNVFLGMQLSRLTSGLENLAAIAKITNHLMTGPQQEF
jgi:magnesium-transporting ATPase (P-type)